ncbi:uncharacterized protein [Clytia hemisphaerica]|uniref:MADF domain-containing protein n=1 Tax=Clytia hemisphaerica TaxID=252671 RepID=A0A7M5WS79_9CNID
MSNYRQITYAFNMSEQRTASTAPTTTYIESKEEEEDERVPRPHSADMGRGNTPANMNEDSRSSRMSPISINGDLSPSQTMGNMRALSFMNSGKRGRKTDREREEAGGRREWNDNEISTLIALWSDNDILYDTNHPLYYVQSERKLVMEFISKEMNISQRDVNDKMHSLRTYYCSQRQRTEALDAKCVGSSRAFPRWKFYDKMSFLYESVTNRAAKSSLNTTRRGRKPREPSRGEQLTSMGDPSQPTIPYTMIPGNVRNDYSPTTSSALRNEPNNLHSNAPERTLYSDERFENTNGHLSHSSSPFTKYQIVSSPESTGSTSRKRHCPEDVWAEAPSLTPKDIQTQHSIRKENNHTPFKTIEVPLNTADEIFGHMVACSLAQMSDEQQKEHLKLEIQKLIYTTRFKAANGTL